jgi:hypothetical protein
MIEQGATEFRWGILPPELSFPGNQKTRTAVNVHYAAHRELHKTIMGQPSRTKAPTPG